MLEELAYAAKFLAERMQAERGRLPDKADFEDAFKRVLNGESSMQAAWHAMPQV